MSFVRLPFKTLCESGHPGMALRVGLWQLSADIVAKVCDCTSEAAASIFQNGPHYPLFEER
jgi:hypothetical protein